MSFLIFANIGTFGNAKVADLIKVIVRNSMYVSVSAMLVDTLTFAEPSSRKHIFSALEQGMKNGDTLLYGKFDGWEGEG